MQKYLLLLMLLVCNIVRLGAQYEDEHSLIMWNDDWKMLHCYIDTLHHNLTDEELIDSLKIRDTIPSAVGVRAGSIDFMDSLHGYMIQNCDYVHYILDEEDERGYSFAGNYLHVSSRIYYTNDGGMNWTERFSDTTEYDLESWANGICCFDTNNVFYVTSGLLRQSSSTFERDSIKPATLNISHDGGYTWEKHELDVYSICHELPSTSRLGDSYAIAVFEEDILITMNRWESWDKKNIQKLFANDTTIFGSITHAEILSDSSIMMSISGATKVGDNKWQSKTMIYRSTDFGESWVQVTMFNNYSFAPTSFFDFIDSETWITHVKVRSKVGSNKEYLLYITEGGNRIDTLKSYTAYNLANPFVCAYDKDLIISQYLTGFEHGLRIYYDNCTRYESQFDTIRWNTKRQQYHDYIISHPSSLRGHNLPQLDAGFFINSNKFIGIDFEYNAVFLWERNSSGINESHIIETDNMKLYPNPAGESITIEYLSDSPHIQAEIEIYTIEGQSIAKFDMLSNPLTYDVSSLSRGVYICKIIEENKSSVCLFIKN